MLAEVKPWDLVWIGVVTVALLLGAVVSLILVLRWRRKVGEEGVVCWFGAGFTLREVADLHERGLISEEEYEQLRRKALEAS